VSAIVKTDQVTIGPRRIAGDVAAAWYLLLRIPCPVPIAWQGPSSLAASAWAFPLIGALAGAIGGIVYFVAHWLHLPAVISAGLALAAMIAASGALHEDAFADFWDSFGGRDKARRLEIMRDSRIGTFGAVTLLISLGLRWSAIVALQEPLAVFTVLAAAGALSRVACVAIMRGSKPARRDGLGAAASGVTIPVLVMAIAMAVALTMALIPVALAAGLFAVTIAVSLLMIPTATLRFGGYTGDVLGAGQQFADLAILITAVALLS